MSFFGWGSNNEPPPSSEEEEEEEVQDFDFETNNANNEFGNQDEDEWYAHEDSEDSEDEDEEEEEEEEQQQTKRSRRPRSPGPDDEEEEDDDDFPELDESEDDSDKEEASDEPPPKKSKWGRKTTKAIGRKRNRRGKTTHSSTPRKINSKPRTPSPPYIQPGRPISTDLRRHLIHQVDEGGKTITEVFTDNGINRNNYRRWKNNIDSKDNDSPSPQKIEKRGRKENLQKLKRMSWVIK